MILLFADASPFARKCRVLIADLGADEEIELRDIGPISPLKSDDTVCAQGPLGKVPILIRERAPALYDSGVICEYINHAKQGGLFPVEGEARWCALRLQALADGMMEAAVAVRYDLTFRKNVAHDDQWHDRQAARLLASVEALNDLTGEFCVEPTIGEISAACALSYLDLRFQDLDWRFGRKPLEKWFSSFAERPSMIETQPKIQTVHTTKGVLS
ncbi:MAG: glutathione S-transferase family protein [Parvibaculaceae bacterium]